MGLVDTHCHLQDKAFDGDRDEVLQRAFESLDWLVVVGDRLESSRAALELGSERVYVAAGIHPYHAADVCEDSISSLREMLGSPGVVALGEIGLDYHNVVSPPPIQQVAFERQLELAAELNLPVVIHNRDAHDDVSAIIRNHYKRIPGGIMHCFSGDSHFVERCLEWDFHISFAGNITFPKAVALREAARAVPLNRLLAETDSPYLAPQPVRGRRCEPAFVRHTASALAAVKDVSEDELAQQTTENARRLFRVSDAPGGSR